MWVSGKEWDRVQKRLSVLEDKVNYPGELEIWAPHSDGGNKRFRLYTIINLLMNHLGLELHHIEAETTLRPKQK